MEEPKQQFLQFAVDVGDDRAAFHRMLMQGANAAPVVALTREPVKGVFDENVQAAYTHGLEHIYALENVDPSSIRRIVVSDATEAPKTSNKYVKAGSEEFSLDFGPGYRCWVEPLVLLEPISVLGLSHQAERLLVDAGREILADLMKVELQHGGLGQGHIHEVCSKLTNYLEGKDLERSEHFDVEAFIRALLRFCDMPAAHILLQSYQLESVAPLSLASAAELRRASGDRISRWREEAVASFKAPHAQRFIHDKMSEVISALVIPWVRRRQGIAVKGEIIERLQRVAINAALVDPFLRLIKDLYGDLGDFLEQPMKGLCCADRWIAGEFRQVIECVYSYFYHPEVYYPIEQLLSLVMRELAMRWEGSSEPFILQALSCCALFNIRKEASGQRIVRLA